MLQKPQQALSLTSPRPKHKLFFEVFKNRGCPCLKYSHTMRLKNKHMKNIRKDLLNKVRDDKIFDRVIHNI